MHLIPTVIEKDNQTQYAFDIYSKLLEERIILLTGQIDDKMASSIIGQLLYLESQDENSDIVQRSNDEWYVDGQCPFHDFLLYFDIEDIEADEYNTMSGLVLDLMEHIPTVGEFVEWQGFRIEIADMDGIRIDKLLVKRLPKEEE